MATKLSDSCATTARLALLKSEWHPNQGRIDAEHLEGLDVVVHLAGESIASGRWTREKKTRHSRKPRQRNVVVERSTGALVSAAVGVS